MNYDLSFLEEDNQYISRIIDKYYGCDVIFTKKIGEGFYGGVYIVDIGKEPSRVVVKWYKQSGRNIQEEKQLKLLRKHSLIKVPEVYFVHSHSEDIPFEALLMEYVEGVNAASLPTDHINRDKFVEEMVGNLIHLHSISNNNGFGDGVKMFSDWRTCYGERINNLHQILHLDFKDTISPYLMKVVDESWDSFDKIFVEPVEKSSLIHSDYNLWNILVDKNSAKITAIIDPLDAGWGDKEIDLFHLQNADGDRFGLLQYYQRNSELSELFIVKNAFYWFWDDIKHMINMGWYDEESFTSSGKKLLSLKHEYIGG
ncbi:phosphotransferase [Vallitalea okinawensis]|uniref:phosphotransferase n=1 Tax=Vallitalea okinawensis TaxID=2078660 RepID=UPI000CFB568D|nr:phosphotransferase [Vallitalea okinawensis]